MLAPTLSYRCLAELFIKSKHVVVGAGKNLDDLGLPEELLVNVGNAPPMVSHRECKPKLKWARNRVAVPCSCYGEDHYWFVVTCAETQVL